MLDRAALLAPIVGEALTLAPLTAAARATVQAFCPADDDAWTLFPASYGGEHFAASFDALVADATRHPFVIREHGRAVGMTGYLNLALHRETLEIGGTYLTPAVRGTGLNGRVKRLLLDRAFGCGIRRIEFRIDERNARSQAAIAKLGAVKEGVLRAERITWTGHVRDTGIWSILRDEWSAA